VLTCIKITRKRELYPSGFRATENIFFHCKLKATEVSPKILHDQQEKKLGQYSTALPIN